MGINVSKKLMYGLFVLLMGILLTLSGCGGSDSDGALSGEVNIGAADDGGFAYPASESYGGSTEGESADRDTGVEEATGAAVQPGAPNTAAGFGSDEDNQTINRKLIYRADVTMEVDEYSKVQAEIRNLIQLSGGYLLEFSESRSEYEDGGTFVIKVPSSGFMSFLNRLEEMSPEHYASKITGQDVTEEYVDLEARLRAKQITEQRLLTFMDQASRADELVEFSRELGYVQQEIEQIKGRMRYLEQHVAFSTIEARVYERTESVVRLQEVDEPPFGKRLTGAVKAVLNGISVVLQELIILIVAAIPIVIVLGLIASPFYFWYRHRARQDPRGWANQALPPMVTPPQQEASLAPDTVPHEIDERFGTSRVGDIPSQPDDRGMSGPRAHQPTPAQREVPDHRADRAAASGQSQRTGTDEPGLADHTTDTNAAQTSDSAQKSDPAPTSQSDAPQTSHTDQKSHTEHTSQSEQTSIERPKKDERTDRDDE